MVLAHGAHGVAEQTLHVAEQHCLRRVWRKCQADQRRAAPAEDDTSHMVELNGMLVSAAAAQRRQFLSSLIQRAAKMKPELGGGSLTLVLSLPGMPATGERALAQTRRANGSNGAEPDMSKYQHLSEEMKAKLAAALRAKAAAADAAVPGADWGSRMRACEVLLMLV